MALWQPPREPPVVPAPAEALQGPGNLMQKGMESPLVAILCLGGAVWCLGQAALAGGAQWEAYLKLLEESRWAGQERSVGSFGGSWPGLHTGARQQAGSSRQPSREHRSGLHTHAAPHHTAVWQCRRFINVMTVDFLTLSALAPFWMSNDAVLRRWEGRDSLLPLLSVLPVLGPCIYLCLRPRSKL